jgi:guanine nucleotide-binding protein G(i) subunit alpha
MGAAQHTHRREIQKEALRPISTLSPLKDPNTVTLLLLGAPESGKQTIYTTFQHSFSKQLNEIDLLDYKFAVYFNAFYAMDQILEAANRFSASNSKTNVRKDTFTCKDFIIVDDRMLTVAAVVHELVEAALMGGSSPYGDMSWKNIHMLKKLWDREPVIKRTVMRGNEFGLIDSCRYMMQNLDRLANENYVPTIEDVLNLRVTVENEQIIAVDLTQLLPHVTADEQIKVVLRSLPGQARTHQQVVNVLTQETMEKYAFIDVALYVISLAEYDQLGRDGEPHRTELSLKLFEETINAQDIIGDADFYLIFNKRDLFLDKIMWKDMFACVPMFTKLKKNDLMLLRPVQPNPNAKVVPIDQLALMKRDRNLLDPLIMQHCRTIRSPLLDTRPVSINDLNTDELIKIFAFLQTSDICCANQVCYKWYLLSGSDLIWSKICVSHQPNLTEEFVQQIFEENVFTVFNTRLRETRTLRRTHRVFDRIAYFNEMSKSPSPSRVSPINATKNTARIMSMVSPRGLAQPSKPLLRELQIMSAHVYKSYFMTMRRLFQSNVDFLVNQYLSRVHDVERREMLKSRVFVTNALDTREIASLFTSIVESYLENS